MTTTQPAQHTEALAPEQGLIIVNCSREKLVTSAPIPALELYQGACVPHLREHFATDPIRQSRIRILSAAHGLLRPEDTISTYERRLRTHAEAERLHEQRVARQLDADIVETPAPAHLLIIVEPLYLLALRRLFDHLSQVRLTCLPDPCAWTDGLAVLHRWGWA